MAEGTGRQGRPGGLSVSICHPKKSDHFLMMSLWPSKQKQNVKRMWRKIKHVVATWVSLTHEAQPPETQSGDLGLWGNIQLVLGSNGEIIYIAGSSLQVEVTQVASFAGSRFSVEI